MEPVIFSEEELRNLCSEWQRILRLQDWDVIVTIERASSMKLTDVNGECEWALHSKQARIRIVDPIDYPPGVKWPQDMEHTLVHELLHLHFAPFDQFEGQSPENIALEQAVDLITGALIQLRRRLLPCRKALN